MASLYLMCLCIQWKYHALIIALRLFQAYIHTRMRAKTSDFLKVLNRARPDAEKKEMKTISWVSEQAQKGCGCNGVDVLEPWDGRLNVRRAMPIDKVQEVDNTGRSWSCPSTLRGVIWGSGNDTSPTTGTSNWLCRKLIVSYVSLK